MRWGAGIQHGKLVGQGNGRAVITAAKGLLDAGEQAAAIFVWQGKQQQQKLRLVVCGHDTVAGELLQGHMGQKLKRRRLHLAAGVVDVERGQKGHLAGAKGKPGSKLVEAAESFQAAKQRACGRLGLRKAGPHGGKGRRRMAEGLVNAPIQRMQLRRRAKAQRCV